jgi:F-type H+-transporting ATPase subunit b
VSPELANFLFEAANFLVLAGALGWVLFKPVRRALDAERARHAEALAEVERRSSELDAQQAKLTAERESLAAEAEAQRAELLEDARRKADEIREAARQASAGEQARVQRELDARRRAELEGLVEQVGSLAAETVRRLMRELSGPALDHALIRAAASELEGVVGEATVEAARSLDGEARQLLDAALPAGYRVQVRPDLGAGLRVSSASGQVDLSALGFAREVRRSLPRELEQEAQGA